MLVINDLQSAGKKPEEMDLHNPKKQVRFGREMFFAARHIVQKYGYAVAVDGAGEARAVIGDQYSLYAHPYLYTGGLDMEFLNGYECVFLMQCNEFAVELCSTALPH